MSLRGEKPDLQLRVGNRVELAGRLLEQYAHTWPPEPEVLRRARSALDDALAALGEDAVPVPSGRNLLSPREREIVDLVAMALSNRQIAVRLAITEGTVKRHLRNIFTKLGAVSRLDVVNKAGGQAGSDPAMRGA
ncbi:helix-turn-helix transcriptional regulator [Nocardia pseudovaccinii]|uniref:helix-turn-helix transcriptional regulator n=1 Tax=Nocardia pseudovaccinii TaxID=189540 RepID=UPI003D8B4E6C